MICFSQEFLKSIGMTDAEIGKIQDGGGLATSPLFSFGGGGNAGRDTSALEEEPTPRALVLVGMADRYNEGAGRAASVVEMCLDERGVGHRKPTKADVLVIFETLARCTNEHAAAIGARLQAAVE